MLVVRMGMSKQVVLKAGSKTKGKPRVFTKCVDCKGSGEHTNSRGTTAECEPCSGFGEFEA